MDNINNCSISKFVDWKNKNISPSVGNNKTNELMQIGEDATAIGLELEDFEKFIIFAII